MDRNSEPEFGTLHQVPLRCVWKHEALDFTPWLAENLNRLSKVIGFELKYERREAHVGPYRVDVVATDPRDDGAVIIENQLQSANLQHLGQVLAYLSGRDAKAAIWIAADFDDTILSAVR